MTPDLCRIAEKGFCHRVLAISGLIVTGFCWETALRATEVTEVVDQVGVDSYTGYLQNDLYAHDGDERCYGPQHDLARQNIQDRFEGFGLTTSLEPFMAGGVEYYNIVAVLPGVIRPDEIYIFGAHYDTSAGCPGAYDNAAGVASVLEAARVLSHYCFEETIVFTAYDREESGYLGSLAYVQDHRLDRIQGVISADCIAYRPYGPETPEYNEVGVWYYSGGTDIADDLRDALGLYAALTCFPAQGDTGSDHVPFGSAGFASALLIARATCSPWYHTPSDSVEKFTDSDYQYGTAITRGAVGYLATQATLAPVRLSPDFNADRRVDIKDLTLLIEHWGQDDPPFDIAPPPMGDGVVDVQDLEGLMYYWDEDIPDPALVAHWRLDEMEGMTAHDAVGDNDAALHGEPIWQPAAGMTGGAIQFDGVDDYVTTSVGFDASVGPFSVFAWVKGGAPGQVILSQAAGGANWLMAASSDGALRTDLKSAGRQGKSLTSMAIVTDGNWHRAGLTWDGTNRILYVDDIEVAKDTQASLPGEGPCLYIGAGGNLAPGTYWSGLIDDVRIYNRALQP